MEIKTINIEFFDKSSLLIYEDVPVLKKSLPFLSVVQAFEGHYGIGIDSPEQQKTSDKGVFIAPQQKMQYISHYVDNQTKIMRAHWIFLKIKINSIYDFDEIYEPPIVLPNECNEMVYTIIDSIEKPFNICENLSKLYLLIDIIIKHSILKKPIDPLKNQIKEYINNSYSTKTNIPQMANTLNISVPTLFRKFKIFFLVSPSNYINDLRLQKASFLLEKTPMLIKEIAFSVGFDDVFYFSKLFKKKYGLSPVIYRNQHKISF